MNTDGANSNFSEMRMERYERLFKQAVMPDEVKEASSECFR